MCRAPKLELAQTTRQAFYEYYLLSRELELNQQRVLLLEEFRHSARVKYENNLVTEQDVLQADVELAEIGRRRLELERMYRVAVARINTLLRRNPDDLVPAAPARLGDVADPPPVLLLREMAMAQRPDLAALRARVRTEEVAVNLARKQYLSRHRSLWPLRLVLAAGGHAGRFAGPGGREHEHAHLPPQTQRRGL